MHSSTTTCTGMIVFSIMTCRIWRKHLFGLIRFIVGKFKIISIAEDITLTFSTMKRIKQKRCFLQIQHIIIESQTFIWTIIQKFYVIVLFQEIWIGMLSHNLVNGCDHCIYISSHQYQRAPLDINLFLSYVPFLYPWKHQKACWYSNYSRVYEKETLSTNGL